MMKKLAPLFALFLILSQVSLITFARPSRDNQYNKTALLTDREITALAAEINGLIAKDTVIELARNHRVQASIGFSHAAQYIASKAKEYGLEQVEIERFPADGQKTYYTLRSTPGWEAAGGELWENKTKVADYDEMRVALADYSRSAD